MAVNKSFVIKNGLEVNTNLILANPISNSVGIGTSVTNHKLHVNGGIGATDITVTGFGTVTNIFGDIINYNNASFNVGVVTTLSGSTLNYSGIATVGSLNIGADEVISSAKQLKNIASLDSTTTATIEAAIANAPNTFTNLVVTGVSTLGVTGITTLNVSGISTLGTVEISSGIVTATSGIVTYYGDGQYLDLSGNVSGGIGIGTTGGPIGYGVTFLVFGSGISSTTSDTSSGITTIYLAQGDSPNNGTLTLNTSGTGLSGSATFTANQSGNSTFTVTSNATSSNTSSTIVARDGSGNFSAGTITANLTGTASSATNATNAANIGIAATVSSDTFASLVLVADQSTGNQSPFIDSGLTYNANTDTLFTTNFSGTATNATNITLADESSDTTCFPVFAITATGNQAPKTDSSALTYDASTGTLSATNVNSTSDINLKKDIEVIHSSNEILNQISGIRFTWKETEQKSLGVIAQEIEKVLPELISERTDNGVKSVNYNGLVGVLIEAVKELSREIEELKQKIS